MEQYVVSARKYRPARFSDVVGQEHITVTLLNALKQHQLAHAFLFCGPRGVGKTTCARILAKIINCQSPTETNEACEQCSSCVSFNESTSFNIYELDAASNNSVDDIRQLIEQVRIPPQGGQFKVYIIDEVHMLSSQAFNAFLKTLEEPPSYAIFILATTERHKILPTILSRCQVFDFHRIPMDAIVGQLKKIVSDRGLQADEDSLHLIAQKADGGLRDALSLFDKMASFCNGNIELSAVLDQLNILDADFYFTLTDAMLAEDVATVMQTIQAIILKGFEGDTLLNGLGEHFRNVLVAKYPSTINMLEASENVKRKYLQQAQTTPSQFLLSALNLINEADQQYRMSKNKRLHTEMTLIRLCYLNSALQGAVSLDKKKNELSESTAPANAPIQTPNPTPAPAPAPVVSTPVSTINPIAASVTTNTENTSAASVTSTPANTPAVKPVTASVPATPTASTASAPASNPFSLKGMSREQLQKQAKEQLEQLKQQASAPDEKKPETIANTQETTNTVKVEETAVSNNGKPYTPAQRFDVLSKKYPDLINFTKILNLDVDW
ncbi:MAG: DNA polymerase III subunit gamma/tau [Chitinophagales bacterium]|nr:DNA polymerase III subunit gamma/tau [Chitinophagales bacterium]